MVLSNLVNDLHKMGFDGTECVMIHSSCKSIGYDANDILDTLIEFFKYGNLIMPTHTWGIINENNPIYDVKNTPSNLGILNNLFLKRDGVIRSHHPTHSVAIRGNASFALLANEVYANTPCTPHGFYDKLREYNAYVLLIGVGNERNTFIHSVEEVLNVPNRLTEKTVKLYVKNNNQVKEVYMRKHFNKNQPHISEDFPKLDEALYEKGCMKDYKFGNAKTIVFNTKKGFNLIRHILAKDPEVIVNGTITKDMWEEYDV